MRIEDVAFCTTVWEAVPATQHKGETGTAIWRLLEDAEPHRSKTAVGAKLFVVD